MRISVGPVEPEHYVFVGFKVNGRIDLNHMRIMAIAGHVSRRMLERYSHIRMEAKRTALKGLSGQNQDGNSYGTVYGTMGDLIPVYTELNVVVEMDAGRKKLEVAIVPE